MLIYFVVNAESSGTEITICMAESQSLSYSETPAVKIKNKEGESNIKRTNETILPFSVSVKHFYNEHIIFVSLVTHVFVSIRVIRK